MNEAERGKSIPSVGSSILAIDDTHNLQLLCKVPTYTLESSNLFEGNEKRLAVRIGAAYEIDRYSKLVTPIISDGMMPIILLGHSLQKRTSRSLSQLE